MKKVRTVCGDIAPERLGTTMIHEHVAINLSPVTAGSRTFFPQIKDEQLTLENRNLKFLQSGAWSMAPEVMDTSGDDYLKFIVNELKEYKAVGGEALCECSVYGILGRPYEDLVRASEESGVNIVYGVGMYRDSVRPAKFQGKSEDEIPSLFAADSVTGVEVTGI